MYVPENILPVLDNASIRYIVMGTHGVGAWRKGARATQDVDFLIVSRDHAKAVDAVHKAFPELEVIEAVVVTRFRDASIDEVVIDLMRPNQPLFKLAFRNRVWVEEKGYWVPNLEFALASKFAAMVSPHRRASKKMIDGGDFMNIVETHKDSIRRQKLAKLAELVYKGGGSEVLRMVDDTLAGKTLVL